MKRHLLCQCMPTGEVMGVQLHVCFKLRSIGVSVASSEVPCMALQPAGVQQHPLVAQDSNKGKSAARSIIRVQSRPLERRAVLESGRRVLEWRRVSKSQRIALWSAGTPATSWSLVSGKSCFSSVLPLSSRRHSPTQTQDKQKSRHDGGISKRIVCAKHN